MGTVRRVNKVRESHPDVETKDHIRQLARAINGILEGETNDSFEVELAEGETETRVKVDYALDGAFVYLGGRNSSGWKAISDIEATVETGEVVLTHPVPVAGVLVGVMVRG